LIFFHNIIDRINRKDFTNVKQLYELLKDIYYQKISFEEANEIVSKCNYQDWSNKTQEIHKNRYSIDTKDRSGKEIIQQMISKLSRNKNAISSDILKTVDEQTEKFKNLAKNKNVSDGDEKSEISREIQEIFNLESYQNNPSEYVYSHLNDIVPLLLYSWSIANKPVSKGYSNNCFVTVYS
jgi:hypothetical protein